MRRLGALPGEAGFHNPTIFRFDKMFDGALSSTPHTGLAGLHKRGPVRFTLLSSLNQVSQSCHEQSLIFLFTQLVTFSPRLVLDTSSKRHPCPPQTSHFHMAKTGNDILEEKKGKAIPTNRDRSYRPAESSPRLPVPS